MIKDSLEQQTQKRKISDLVNTPFKKVMFALQILSYFLIVGSPVIGGFIGKAFEWNTAKTGGVILVVFIIGEILFYGSLFFLGKEIVFIIKDRAKKWFKRSKAA